MRDLLICLGLAALMAAAACARVVDAPAPTPEPTQASSPAPEPSALPVPTVMEVKMSFEMTSTAFKNGESIPPVYSCRGSDISVPLDWNDPPEGTQSFALIVSDPDAPGGTWIHWVVYNLPAGVRKLPKAVSHDAQLSEGGMQGRNSWNQLGYGGPCPPSGTHRYFFRLYALDSALDLSSGARLSEVEAAIEGHVLAQAELMGTFSK
jgi:Raf kinase inhibitor-like YbhB/YbcL family protein